MNAFPKTNAPALLDKMREQLLPVFQRYGILKAIVFGSFAMADASPKSDLDLILVQQTNRRFLDRYDGLLHDLQCAVPDRDLDVLIYTPSELTAMQNRPFIASALRNGLSSMSQSKDRNEAERWLATAEDDLNGTYNRSWPN